MKVIVRTLSMLSGYEDFFKLIDEKKIKDIVEIYRATAMDRKFVSTWKNFYEEGSDMIAYIGFYNDASNSLFEKIIDYINKYSKMRIDILALIDVHEENVTGIISNIRNIAKSIDKIYDEVHIEYQELEKLFRDIWNIYDEDFNVPALPLIPPPLVTPNKDKKDGL
jgi:hypothetical protein